MNFNPDEPRKDDPVDPSRAAYESVKAHIPTIQGQILSLLLMGPKTCDEMEVILDMPHQTVSACITGLKKAGAVRDSGKRRPTRTGRKAAVLEITEPPATPATLATNDGPKVGDQMSLIPGGDR